MSKLIECVPNFSEGRDRSVIDAIAAQPGTVDGVRLLDVDPGAGTNRTVVTFVGPPEAVVEAAVRCGRKASELIDMRHHRGEHPRFGAMDVCPLIPVSGITMDETVAHARALARRLGEEVGLSVYCYEFAASSPARRNLADVRAGEYEGLAARMARPDWKPDFGPAAFQPRTGATAVGARKFLVAYNVNLNTTSTRRANAIAFDVRERGRPKRKGDPLTGPIATDERGQQLWIPGALKACKAIGWFIEEYGLAQISMNLTDIDVTPVHVAFEEVCRRAEARGIRVTGSELVGLIPLQAMLDAGRYFLHKQQRSSGVSDAELVRIAIASMGLDQLHEFDPGKKIIEYAVADPRERRLASLSVRDFVHETAADSPAPGGGSVAALLGSLGAALGTMVANLSAHKRGWDARWQEFSEWAERGKACHAELLRLVDADTRAFDALLAAFGLPKASEADKAAREAAVQGATRGAIEIPLRVMEVALSSMQVLRAMVETGLASSVSDAGVGALAARSAVLGAHLNVKTNATGLKDRAARDDYLARGAALAAQAVEQERAILAAVESRLADKG